jgi:lipopolysaccharide biosynthesis glycosyltransferase
VLVVDLDRWRREDIGAQAIAVARNEPHRITWWDQCALNIVLRGRWMPLDQKWNLQTNAIGPYEPYEKFGVNPTPEGLAKLRAATVIHFTNRTKPWQYLCEHPAKPRYWHYLGKTPWRDYRMPDLTARSFVRKNLMLRYPSVLRAYYELVARFR